MKCETCRWYSATKRPGVGECRYAPPTRILKDGIIVSGFPMVKDNDWCASWAGGRLSWRGEPVEVLDRPSLYEGDECD